MSQNTSSGNRFEPDIGTGTAKKGKNRKLGSANPGGSAGDSSLVVRAAKMKAATVKQVTSAKSALAKAETEMTKALQTLDSIPARAMCPALCLCHRDQHHHQQQRLGEVCKNLARSQVDPALLVHLDG